MTVTCPAGHVSETTDYCDQCGAPIQAPTSGAPSVTGPDEAEQLDGEAEKLEDEDGQPEHDAEQLEDEDTSPAARREPCPRCGAPRSGDDRFCEACGHDFETPGSDADDGDSDESVEAHRAAAWELVAQADRQQFERFTASGISFPVDFTERRFPVAGPRLRIGRSRGREEAKPEVDLAGTPEDPGISRWHATLERQEDGTYVLRDLGSTNGTLLNDDPNPLEADVPVPLSVGDRIRIGAWTTITVRAR